MTLGSQAGHLGAAKPTDGHRSLGALLSSPKAQELRTRLSAFTRWWAAELWACLPESWRRRLRHREQRLFITVEADGAHAAVVGLDTADPLRAFALAPETAQDAASLAVVKRAIRKDGARLDVLVPEDAVVRCRFKLSLAAENDLRNALASELARDPRFQARDVYFDYSVVAVDRESKSITVDAAIVPRAIPDKIVAALRGAKLRPRTVCAWRKGAKRPDATFLNVSAERSATAVRALSIALATLVFALDVAAAYVPLLVKIDNLGDIQYRMKAIRPQIEDVLKLEQTLDALRGRNAHLVALKKQTPGMAEVLAEVARALPDSAWLEQLQVQNGRVHLAGFGTAPASLIAALQQSPMLADVRFEWPVLADAAANADRFDISARIESPTGDRR